MKYQKLFEEGKIGHLKLKNRVVMAPLAVGANNEDQSVSDAMIAYYEERARGGVGLIIAENTRVNDEHGVAAVRQMSVARDDLIPSLQRLSKAIHAHGTKIFVQLHHPGRETYANLNGNQPVVAPSAIPCGVCRQETRALTLKEVEALVQDFIEGALRAQKAGMDGVELHGAHGYLISQFLSPYTNKRTDKYGGSFDKRLTFIQEVIAGIKEACGQTYPVGVRLTVDELLDKNGVTEPYLDLKEGLRIARALEKMGIDVLNISHGIYETLNALSEPMTYPQGARTSMIQTVKQVVQVPVIAVDVVKEPAFAEQLLEEHIVDFIGLGRALVADAYWVNKAYGGREEEICKCISCCYCFETLLSDVIPNRGSIQCAVNPRAVRELAYPAYQQEGAGRKVVVIGAGCAGLEAARVLALRGFRPVILEKDSTIGGQINLANKPPMKDKINYIIDYERHQLNRLGVEIRLNCKATVEAIKDMQPYAVFVATGAEPIVPQSIEGIARDNVCTIQDVLCGRVILKGKKVALIGSGLSGLETAELLCTQGNEVSIIEMLDEIGKGVYVQHLLDAKERLGKFPVHMMPGHQLIAITDNGVTLQRVADKSIVTYPTDEVVLSLGVKSRNTLGKALQKEFPLVYLIGDAKQVGRIESAVRSGFEAAIAL